MALLSLVSLALLTSGCAMLPGPLAPHREACIPAFEYAGGWLGGDAVYSIPVPSGKRGHETIWLFGDTYVGPPEARSRAGSRLIHNTVGRSACNSQGKFEIEYAWKRDVDGAPVPVFRATRKRHYAWPFDGFFKDGRLYVFLAEVRSIVAANRLGLPIRIAGMSLARVENPDDPIAYWRVDVRPITPDRFPLISTAALVDGDFVYMMASPGDELGRHPRFLLRLPLSAVDAWPDHFSEFAETFTHRGAWEPGIQPANARVLMHDNASEMSLDRDAETGRYFVVYGSPLQSADDGSPSATPVLDANSIFVRSAIALTGAWSARRRIAVMPDALWPDEGRKQPIEMCYAAKAHAELSPQGVLVATYACNLAPGAGGDVWGTLQSMQSRMDLYRPQVLLHAWPLLNEDGFRPDTDVNR